MGFHSRHINDLYAGATLDFTISRRFMENSWTELPSKLRASAERS